MPNLQANGVDLWYERSGGGRPIILLHAFAVTSAIWFHQAPVLAAAGYDVICLDLRGHGRSSAPSGAYTISEMAADVYQLIEHLKLGKVCAVGLSMGGRVAMRLALDHPEDIATLVLASTKSEPALEVRDELEALAQRARRGEVAAAIEGWYNRPSYQRLAVVAPDLVSSMKAEWNQKSGNGFADAAQAIIEMESLTPRLAEIRAPTLTIAGELDQPCHPYVALYERTIPDCQGVIVPAAGHFVAVEQPDRFNDLLMAFLATRGG